MRYVFLFLILLLLGCRSSKNIEKTDSIHINLEQIKDSFIYRGVYDDSVTVICDEGSVFIDTAGNIKIDGIKEIKKRSKKNISIDETKQSDKQSKTKVNNRKKTKNDNPKSNRTALILFFILVMILATERVFSFFKK